MISPIPPFRRFPLLINLALHQPPLLRTLAQRPLPYHPKKAPSKPVPSPKTASSPTRPPPPASTKPPPNNRRKNIYYLTTGAFFSLLTLYTYNLYTSLTRPSPLEQDADVSTRYNTLAPTFDSSIALTETLTGISSLRRNLTRQAQGHVLEVAAGTGRNSEYYNLQKCTSITFVDPSGPMLSIAKDKWAQLHPGVANAVFLTQPATAPLPGMPEGGFDTIVQTMGVCSTARPAETLAHLETLLKPGGRMLLLEHGRGRWAWVNWILDRSAGRHAERFGCWFNRDVGGVLGGSGVVVERCERRSLGTVWVVEGRGREWKGGGEEGGK